jgi:phage tail-like protein
MPDLVGMQYRKAKLVAENAGLSLQHVLFTESYEARNTVLQQAPQRGQMVYAGDTVAVAISRESYVRWLPSIYQRSDVSGRNFVKELLWITQHLFSSVEEILNVGHTFYDPYEAPERFLPWLAGWTAMVLEEDWPVAKKRRLLKRAVDLYRIRGTMRGLKLFVALFTGHEPEIRENEWPFRGWRVGTATSAIGVDTVVLPPVNLAHTFIVEMPMAYKDFTPEAVIRIHEIVRMEKPAHTQYYLRFAAEGGAAELREFFVIGERSGIGIGQEILRTGHEEGGSDTTELPRALTATTQMQRPVEDFPPPTRQRRALTNVARADNAPVEGREVRSSEEGFGASAREMQAVDTRSGRTLKAEAAPTVESGAVPSKPMDASDTDENAVDDGRDPPTKIRRKKTDPKPPK